MDEQQPRPKAARMKPPASLPGDNISIDRIRELPDGVLGSILFLLPLKEAGRTTVLSKRWRGVFAHSPIALDDRDLGRHRLGSGLGEDVLRAERLSAITRILAAHKGPVQRVRLEVTRFQGDHDGREGLDPMAFATRGVEELIVQSTKYPIQFFPAPPLRSLQLLNCCLFNPEPPVVAIFTHIKELSLCAVYITEHEVDVLMEQCVALESLQLCSYQKDWEGHMKRVTLDIDALYIISQTLRSLDLDICGLKEVVVWNAPNLERLLGGVKYGSFCEASLFRTPKLRIVGFLSITSNFHRNEAPPIGFTLESQDLCIPSVKTVALCLDLSLHSHVRQMLQRLDFFPSLETLHLKVPTHRNDIHALQNEAFYADCLKYAESVECLRSSVKTIVMSDVLWFSDCCTHKLAGLLCQVTKKLEFMEIVSVSSRRKYNIEEDWTSLD